VHPLASTTSCPLLVIEASVIILDSTLKSVRVVLAGAVATNQSPVYASYIDIASALHQPGSVDTVTDSTTPVVAVTSPNAGVNRQVKLLTVHNSDTANIIVTVSVLNNVTTRNLFRAVLEPGAMLAYTDGEGFRVLSPAGAVSMSLGGGVAASAANGSFSFNTISFSNANGISFSTSAGGAVFASFNPSGTLTMFAVGNTTQSTSGTRNVSSLDFRGEGLASVGVSGGSVVISVPLGAPSPVNFSAGTTSNNLGSVVFGDSNGVVFGLNGATITASVSGGGGIAGISADGSSVSNGTVVWSNSNGVSFGMNGSTVTASVQTNYLTTAMASNRESDFVQASAVFAGTSASGTIGSNGISISVGPYLTTAMHSTQSQLTAFAVSNTTQATSGAIPFSALSFQGVGVASVGISNGSVIINVPSVATSPINFSAGTTSSNLGSVVFNDSNGVIFGLSGATITASVGANTQRLQWPPGNLTAVASMGNGSFSLNRVQMDVLMSATRMDVPFLVSVQSALNTATWALAVTAFGAIYTKNNSTLSSLSSGSTAWSVSLASNTAGQTQIVPHAIRPMSVPININMTPGEYYVGFGISTNASSVGVLTTALNNTWSVMGGIIYSSAVPQVGEFTASTNTSTGLFGGQGIYSSAISTVPPTVNLSDINQTGSYYARGNMGIIFRNI